MGLNTAALKWKLRSILAGKAQDIRPLASQEWEISPPESALIPPAIYLPDTPDRITCLSPWRNWETERLLIQGGTIDHAASTAHLIEDVELAGAYVYRDGADAKIGFGKRQLTLPNANPRQSIQRAHMASNWAGSSFFGNFMLDDIPLGLLPPEDELAIAAQTKDYEHEAGYRELLALPRPMQVVRAKIGQLILYTDFAQNISKAARYRVLRQRMRDGLGATSTEPSRGVYLKRGATGERRIVANEAQVERAMSDLGFDIVEPSSLNAEQISRRILDASIVVSVEGSHLSHAIYSMADGGAFLVLQPPDRFAMPYKEFTDRLEMRFAFLVGHPAADGFTVDIDELNRLVDVLS